MSTWERHCDGILKILGRAKHFWGMHPEIVTKFIPGINDQGAKLKEMARWICDCLDPETPWQVTRFETHFRLARLSPTPIAILEQAKGIGQDAGSKYVYLKNVPGHPAGNTSCPACGKLLIERLNYRVVQYHLDGSCCGYCGHSIAGCF